MKDKFNRVEDDLKQLKSDEELTSKCNEIIETCKEEGIGFIDVQERFK